MTPQDQGAGTDPVRDQVTEFLFNAITARSDWSFSKLADGVLTIVAQAKGIDPTQGKAQDHRAEREARIKAVLADIEGIRKGFCPCGYCGTINNGKCFKCGTDWGINQEPRKAQVEESDGPAQGASPLKSREGLFETALDNIRLRCFDDSEWARYIDRVKGKRLKLDDTPVDTPLDAERSDAPSPNKFAPDSSAVERGSGHRVVPVSQSPGSSPGQEPPPNPLETADYAALYFDLLMQVGMKHPGESRHETAKRYIQKAEQCDPKSHGYEITRTGGREWTLRGYTNLQETVDAVESGQHLKLGEVVRVREVPGSTAGEGKP